MSNPQPGRSPADAIEDRRGLWMPSLPVAIALVLIVGIAIVAAAFSLGLVESPISAPTEVTTEYDASIVDDNDSVAVTVVEESSRDPVQGANVTVEDGTTRLDSNPTRTTNASGTVVFEFGEGEEEITVDWPPGRSLGEVKFDVEPPGEDTVDQLSNPGLTLQQT